MLPPRRLPTPPTLAATTHQRPLSPHPCPAPSLSLSPLVQRDESTKSRLSWPAHRDVLSSFLRLLREITFVGPKLPSIRRRPITAPLYALPLRRPSSTTSDDHQYYFYYIDGVPQSRLSASLFCSNCPFAPPPSSQFFLPSLLGLSSDVDCPLFFFAAVLSGCNSL